MDRRDFLKAGVVAGGSLGLGAAGCGAVLEGMTSAPVPSIAELQALDMGGFLKRLDTSLGFIQSSSTLGSLVKGDVAALARKDPRFEHAEDLLRKGFRSLLLTSSFHDLDEAGRLHPGMQARLWASMGEMDEAVLGMNKLVTSFTPTERADLDRVLRDDATLGSRILKALDEEGEKAGVNDVQRRRLGDVGKAALSRLRRSTTGFIDEYDEKLTRVAARDLTAEAIQRWMMAQMGEDAFWQYHDRQLALLAAWQRVPGIAQAAPVPTPSDWHVSVYHPSASATPPPVASTAPVKKRVPDRGEVRKGNIVFAVGAVCFGLAIVLGLGAATIVASSSYFGPAISLPVWLAAAAHFIGGLTLIIAGSVILADA
ncbi:MAG: hypothetical protein U0441_07290 [Polyangiaceae bacterium]